jgi:Bifunctional PLP-dependent enzyme with beta-cystathionase and maltose regulon repressor activities
MDFDAVIDRRGTLSIKWDDPKNVPGLPDIIPLWVADMDFSPPPAVQAALKKRVEHPIFGYTKAPHEYLELVSAWYAARQGLDLCPDNIVMAPAVIPAISSAIHAFTQRGQGVMIMPPVYHPFESVVLENERVLVEAPLARDELGRYTMDFEGMEKAAKSASDRGIKLRAILISSPHNPVGRVWNVEELTSLLDFAEERDLVILCDELHSDLILGDKPFRSLAGLAGRCSQSVVVFSGPNKTFNIAGLHISQVIARCGEQRRAMQKAISAAGFGPPNTFSLAAAMAAYREGGPWLDELLAYLKGNHAFLLDFLASKLPEVRVSPLEGTYLAWLDFRPILARMGMGEDESPLAQKLEDKGRVRLSPGSGYGSGGTGFFRVNLACPRSTLAEGLERVARSVV